MHRRECMAAFGTCYQWLSTLRERQLTAWNQEVWSGGAWQRDRKDWKLFRMLWMLARFINCISVLG